jgi:hypothetical protein
MENVNLFELAYPLGRSYIWLVLLVVIACGALGGLANMFASPREERSSLASYLVVGSVAAIAILLIFTPTHVIKLIAVSVVAGYAGRALLNEVLAKVISMIAKSKGTEAIQTARQIRNYATELNAYAQELERLLEEKGQPRQALLESFARSVPAKPVVAVKSPEQVSADLEQLSGTLDSLERWFKGKSSD